MKESEIIVLILLLLFRISSILFIRTWFVPDEYWQSIEVAHKIVFNYGYITWEWVYGIRSYIYPLMFSLLYKFLQIFSLDYSAAIIYGPRVLQSILSAYSDFCFFIWAGKTKWALFFVVFSWFWFYVASRTLINTLETCLTAVALSLFPWNKHDKGYKFLTLVAISICIRSTAVIQWFPLCLYHLYLSKENLSSVIIKQYVPIGVIVLVLSITIDSVMHGSFIVTPLEFLRFNVVKDVGSFYGVHPWHWYLSSGLPSLLGINIVPFMLSTLYVLKNRYVYQRELILLVSIVFTIFIYSLLPHKEFRFILPILPMVNFIISKCLSRWSAKKDKLTVWFVVGTIILGNFLPAAYFSTIHQKGTLEVMSALRDIAFNNPQNKTFLFLMPCHSTPLYSHLHVNVSTRFLTCEPNLKNNPNYVHETDTFYKDPKLWIRNNYPPRGKLPSHIILFDVLVPFISDILSRYKPIYQTFHAHVPIERRIGKYVLIYELIAIK